jgi:hypothetical protein
VGTTGSVQKEIFIENNNIEITKKTIKEFFINKISLAQS